MRKIFPLLVVGILVLSGLGAVGVSYNIKNEKEFSNYFDDLSAYKVYIAEGGQQKYSNNEILKNSLLEYPIGTTVWQYTITGGYDNSPKAIAPVDDVNGDGIIDVVVCSENNDVNCFSGGEIGTGVVLWTRNIYSGNIYSQKGITVLPDIDSDGYLDVAVGTTGGSRSVVAISGKDGDIIWTYDTHEYGDGGWVYQVDCSYDYNNDGTPDVLACAGDDSSNTGPKGALCLNGLTGAKIWYHYLGGAGFSVIGVEDFTGDGTPDVLAGTTNEAETTGYAKGLNGNNGAEEWSKTTSGSSVWAVEQIEDITGDGVKDVIVGDFSGIIYGLDATDGNQEYSLSLGGAIITRFAKINDVDSSGHPEIVPAHSTIHTTQLIDAEDGDIVWSKSVADQPWNVARIADVSGDAIDDVLVGTLFNNNYCYFLDGTDGSELASISYGQAVDAIYAIPDVVSDGSMEMVAGGRNGKLTCISGGLDAASPSDPPTDPIITGPSIGAVDWTYCFQLISTDPNGDNVFYFVDWGDGTNTGWLGPYTQGTQVDICHSWSAPGTYELIAKARDENGAKSNWTDPHEITIVENQAPSRTDIYGPSNGKAGTEYDFTFVATDDDGDDLTYVVSWGDGTAVEEFGPVASGEEVVGSHTWEEKGIYIIIALAKDIYEEEGEFETYSIKITKNKACINFIQNYKNQFPLLNMLLQRLGLL